jgi:hypothetical protein
MLFFPAPAPPLSAPAPDDFALQYWPDQKLINAGLVLGLIRMLVGGPGGGNQVSVKREIKMHEKSADYTTFNRLPWYLAA